jgi:hypothetical protein
MQRKTCRLCLDGHEREDIFCSTCRRFADWWSSLSPAECRRHEQVISDSLDVSLPRRHSRVKSLTASRVSAPARA